MTSPSPAPGANNERPVRANFWLPWEIVVAPARAYDRIAATPEWLIALAIVVLLEGVAAYAQFPAAQHVVLVLSRTMGFEKPSANLVWEQTLQTCEVAALKIMITAMALTIFAGTRDAKKMAAFPVNLSLAANCAVIAAIGDFLVGTADVLRSPTSFNDVRSLDMVFPVNMTVFAEPGNWNQAFFLTHFGLFSIWADIVLALGFAKLANLRVVSALVFVFTLELAFSFIL